MEIASKKINNILKIDGRVFSIDEIVNDLDKIDLKSYYKDTLIFVRDWLIGKEEFKMTTSGSTGKPREIILRRKQMELSARGTAEALDFTGFRRSLVCINTNYIGGKMMIVRSLEYGLEMNIVEPILNPLEGLSGNEFYDFAAMVPMQLENILLGFPRNEHVFNGFKAIIVGGAPVSSGLISLISDSPVPIYATYGMTETVSHIALQRLNGANRDHFFTALDEVSLKTDDRGCLSVCSPATNNEWIDTNDVVELVNNQEFKFLGRIDNVINSGGVKVHPERVEVEVGKVFEELGITARFFIRGFSDGSLGAKVCLVVEGEPQSKELEKHVLGKIKERLPVYHNPKEIFYIKEFKETATGKVDRNCSLPDILV